MHSSIIQISRNVISEDEYITPDDYCESDLIGRDIDYVSDVIPDRQKELEELKKYLDSMTADIWPDGAMHIRQLPEGQTLAYFYVNKAAYFKHMYKGFRRNVAMLQIMTEEEFSGIEGANEAERCMKDTVKAFRYGGNDYLVNYDGQHMTLTEFMRLAEDQEKAYTIGGILNYHY